MEGPYRDLGKGFVRLSGAEGARRAPSRITSVETALLELLRNSREAGARNVYVASTLRRRRFRTLTVIDDGDGILEDYTDLIFEPGVTTRHFSASSQGAGLSLYHLREAALEARVLSAASPTVFQTTFDTTSIPERSLQSSSRRSGSNMRATLGSFLAAEPDPPALYLSSPSHIIATLIDKRIIQTRKPREVRRRALDLGLNVSLRTVQRILAGKVLSADTVEPETESVDGRGVRRDGSGDGDERILRLGDEEEAEIRVILERILRARYLELGGMKVESKPGEVSLRISFYEPEDEYE